MILSAASSGLSQRLVNGFSRAAIALMNVPVPSASRPLDDERWGDMVSTLEPGDILLETSNRYPGWQVAQFALYGSDYSHSMVYSGSGRIVDANTDTAVSERPLEAFRGSHHFAVVRPRWASPADPESAVEYARSMVGRPYDDRFETGDDRAFYCSELVAGALAHTSHPIPVPSRTVLGREIIAPDAFRRLPETEEVWSSGGTFAKNMASHWPVLAAGAAGAVVGSLGGPVGAAAGVACGLATLWTADALAHREG